MKPLSAIPTRWQNQLATLPLEILDHLVALSVENLPPSQCEHLFHKVGQRLGREAWRRYRIAYRLDRRPTVKDMVQCITGLDELWGWPCTILQQGEDQVSFIAPPLPFAPQSIVAQPIFSSVSSGILGGIAEEAFGYGKACLLPDNDASHTQKRIVVYLHPTQQKNVTPEAVTRKRSTDISKLHFPGNRNELEQLSRRERQVLQCVGEGLTNKETASQLGISVRTVEGHVSRICVKLDLRRRADLIRCSLRHNLATL